MSHQHVSYLTGSNPKRDVGYGRITDIAGGLPAYGPTAGDGGLPVGLIREDYLKWAWRIRQWTLAGTLNLATVGSWTVPDTVIDMVLFDEVTPVPDEKSIISASVFTPISGTGARGNFGYNFVDALAGGEFSLDFQLDFNNSKYDTVGELFWPFIQFRLNLVSGLHTAQITAKPQIGGVPLSLTFDGVTIPDASLSGSTGTWTATVTLTPTLFWVYQNRLGQEVYDELTGAEINDPFA